MQSTGKLFEVKVSLYMSLKKDVNEEQEEWVKLTPQQRYLESCKLWSTYIALGGCLDPEPDSQSPFDFPELQRAVPVNGGTSMYRVRRSRI